MSITSLILGLLGAAGSGRSWAGGERFEPPVPIRVEGRVLELSDPRAVPALGDFFGDGGKDLMVGQHAGRLRVYRDVGAGGRPEFAGPVWFDEILPEGRIPVG